MYELSTHQERSVLACHQAADIPAASLMGWEAHL
jgi:hypothetical protein